MKALPDSRMIGFLWDIERIGFGDDAEHLSVDQAVAGQDMGASKPVRSAAEIGDDTARLGDEQPAGSGIPGHEFQLPETVETAGRHIGQIKGRRTGPANRLGAHGQHSEVIHVVVPVLSQIIGKTGRKEPFIQISRPGDR
jgi:hypothetical protein